MVKWNQRGDQLKILNFGSANIDLVYSTPHIVTPGESLTASQMEIFPGGKGLNQSIAIARAGASVYHAGCVGTDGDFLIDLLSDAGVDTSYIQRVPQKNGHAVIQVSADGENSIIVYSGSNGCVTEGYIDRVLRDFEKGDILLLQNEISCLSYAIDVAYARGMQIVLNPSPFNDELRSLDLSKITYLILNEVEAAEYSGETNPKKSLAYFKANYPDLRVMLTLGKSGCVYLHKEEHFHPRFEVTVVDTTAAGDTFTGYFLAGIAAGDPIDKILKTASCASAIAVSCMGAAPSIPMRSKVAVALSTLPLAKDSAKERLLRGTIEAYVNEHLSDASLTGLASALGYSTVYSGAIASRLLGCSFVSYLQEKRLETAHTMLLEGVLSVGEIIKAVGYENESHFRRLFRKKYGENPKTYRKTREKHK